MNRKIDISDEEEAKFEEWLKHRKEGKAALSEEEAKFEEWYHRRELAKKEKSEEEKEEEDTRPVRRRKRRTGWGKIIGGFLTLAIAVIAYPYMSQFQAIQLENQETCNSFMGEIGQGFDSEMYEQCRASAGTLTTINTILLVIVVIGVLGLVLMILGMAKK